MHLQSVIWDFDGTIINSEAQHVASAQAAFRERGIEIPVMEWERFKGIRFVDVFTDFVQRFATHEVSVQDLLGRSREIYLDLIAHDLRLVPGSLACLQLLRDLVPKMALTTSSHQELQERAFAQLGIAHYFDVVVTGSHTTNGKPHPEPYLLTVERLGVPAANCVVIEDSESGIRSAKAAGCIPIGIATSLPMGTLLDAGAVFASDTFDGILRHIDRLRSGSAISAI